VALSAKTIINLHGGSEQGAEETLKRAEELLLELRKVSGDDLARYLVSPESEFVEASIMLATQQEGKKLPTQSSLGVSSTAYLLGILDAIGELKRAVFNSIRKGDPNRAISMFELMEALYSIAYPFAVYDNIANGVKRKLDVSRSLIEDTRSVVTEEARRREFVETLNDVFTKGIEKVRRARTRA
jgi:translin